MRIAHITAPAQFGGLERVVASLCLGARERGHEVLLVATVGLNDATPAWATKLRTDGVQVESVRLPVRNYVAEKRQVCYLLQKHRVQVVHTHGYRSDVLHSAAARALALPCVTTAHGFTRSSPSIRIYEWMQRRAWRRFDAVVAVSTELRSALERAGMPPSRIAVIRNGISSSRLPPLSRGAARGRLGLSEHGRIAGWVGRFSAEKDPTLALDALRKSSHMDLELCMLGSGRLLEECRRYAVRCGIGSRVHLLGAIPDAGSLLSAFDVLVLSSRTEGTPMVVLEAAIARVPVVSTAVGGLPELLEQGRGGLLVRHGDPGSLAKAIDSVLADGAGATTRADHLRARLMNDTSHGNDWIDQYLHLYQRLLTL